MLHYGLSITNLLEAKVNRVMVEIARKVVAVCDSSKFVAPQLVTDRASDRTASSSHRPRRS